MEAVEPLVLEPSNGVTKDGGGTEIGIVACRLVGGIGDALREGGRVVPVRLDLLLRREHLGLGVVTDRAEHLGKCLLGGCYSVDLDDVVTLGPQRAEAIRAQREPAGRSPGSGRRSEAGRTCSLVREFREPFRVEGAAVQVRRSLRTIIGKLVLHELCAIVEPSARRLPVHGREDDLAVATVLIRPDDAVVGAGDQEPRRRARQLDQGGRPGGRRTVVQASVDADSGPDSDRGEHARGDTDAKGTRSQDQSTSTLGRARRGSIINAHVASVGCGNELGAEIGRGVGQRECGDIGVGDEGACAKKCVKFVVVHGDSSDRIGRGALAGELHAGGAWASSAARSLLRARCRRVRAVASGIPSTVAIWVGASSSQKASRRSS